jgi:hypothetical protein
MLLNIQYSITNTFFNKLDPLVEQEKGAAAATPFFTQAPVSVSTFFHNFSYRIKMTLIQSITHTLSRLVCPENKPL